MNFLLPDRNADQALSLQSSHGYGKALYEIDNPSVYCEGYKWFYQHFCDLLVNNGYPLEAVRSNVYA